MWVVGRYDCWLQTHVQSGLSLDLCNVEVPALAHVQSMRGQSASRLCTAAVSRQVSRLGREQLDCAVLVLC